MPRSIRLLLAVLGVLALTAFAVACGEDDETGSAASGAAATGESSSEKPLKVALLTSGLTNDGGFNQWAAEAAKELESEGKIELQIRQQLSDPNAAEPVLRQFASRGYDLVIGHGIDLSEPTLKVARQFPQVNFATTGDLTLKDKLLDNVDGWTYDFGQFGYVAGVVAGSVQGVDTIGIVSGPKIPFVQAGLKGTIAGIEAENPDAKVEEVFTGEFYAGQKEQEAVRGLVQKGAELVIANVAEGNGVAPAAKAAGIPAVGTQVKGSPAAREVNVTSASLNLLPAYTGYVDRIRSGKFGRTFEIADLANKGIGIEPVNTDAADVPADLQTKVDELSAALASGELQLPNFFE